MQLFTEYPKTAKENVNILLVWIPYGCYNTRQLTAAIQTKVGILETAAGRQQTGEARISNSKMQKSKCLSSYPF
jgi:hypothetical protein